VPCTDLIQRGKAGFDIFQNLPVICAGKVQIRIGKTDPLQESIQELGDIVAPNRKGYPISCDQREGKREKAYARPAVGNDHPFVDTSDTCFHRADINHTCVGYPRTKGRADGFLPHISLGDMLLTAVVTCCTQSCLNPIVTRIKWHISLRYVRS
jgi:hypothetical protein